MEIDLKHVQFKHPSNTLVAGMSGSGKTQLMRRILKNHKLLFHNLKDEISVIWAYGQWHSFIDIQISDAINILYHEGIPTIELIVKHKPDIIIIDDLMNEMNKDNSFENIFTKKSHHMNISVFFLVQNLFYNAKSMRTVSLNCHYMILLKNPRDKSQVTTIARQAYTDNMSYFTDSYSDATLPAYGYIRMDSTPDTDEKFRIMSRLAPEENKGIFSPIVYLPKTKENITLKRRRGTL